MGRQIRFIFIAAAILLTISLFQAPAMGRGVILGVDVSPDLNTVSIKKRGVLGPYNAFVIGSPNRLVIDFRSARLGRTPRRIRISRQPLKEVRLGIRGSGARVVLDFGDTETPAYNIDTRRGEIIVSLARGRKKSRDRIRERPQSPGSADSSQRLNVQRQSSDDNRPSLYEAKLNRKSIRERLSDNGRALTRETPVIDKRAFKRAEPVPQPRPQPERVQLINQASDFRVTQAGAYDGAIFVEVASKKNPESVFRLAFEFNPTGPSVGAISVSDSKGNVSSFTASIASGKSNTPRVKIEEKPEAVESEVGHVEETDEAPPPPVQKRTFGWGKNAPSAGENSPEGLFHSDLKASTLNDTKNRPYGSDHINAGPDESYRPKAFKPGSDPYSLGGLSVTTKAPGTTSN